MRLFGSFLGIALSLFMGAAAVAQGPGAAFTTVDFEEALHRHSRKRHECQ